MSTSLPPKKLIRWSKTYRLIPSRYPPIDLFERIAEPEDWDIVAEIESLTNPRLRDEIGELSLVPANERIAGTGATVIMAAFTHIGRPSRFSDGSYGVYYASNSLLGSLYEVAYHQGVFLSQTNEPKTSLQLRTYIGQISRHLFDVRGGWPEVHDPNSYTVSQHLGYLIHTLAGIGIVYNSVRFKGADNIGILTPKALAAAAGKPHLIQGPHITLKWDGSSFKRYIIMGEDYWKPLEQANLLKLG